MCLCTVQSYLHMIADRGNPLSRKKTSVVRAVTYAQKNVIESNTTKVGRKRAYLNRRQVDVYYTCATHVLLLQRYDIIHSIYFSPREIRS